MPHLRLFALRAASIFASSALMFAALLVLGFGGRTLRLHLPHHRFALVALE